MLLMLREAGWWKEQEHEQKLQDCQLNLNLAWGPALCQGLDTQALGGERARVLATRPRHLCKENQGSSLFPSEAPGTLVL